MGEADVVHLLNWKGEPVCGGQGEADSDISKVTCQECLRVVREAQDSEEA